jgi:hypothetical protein
MEPVTLTIAIVSGVYSLTKSAIDKSNARKKYYSEFQQKLINDKKDALAKNEETRSQALKQIATQYAIEKLNTEKQALELADKKVKQQQLIAVGFGVLSIGLFMYSALSKK